jgi:hypothetical protein
MSNSENKKSQEFILNLKGIKNNKSVIFIILIQFCFIVLLGALLFNMSRIKSAPNITSNLIMDKLSNISELSTVTLDYRGALRVEDGGIKFLTKKAYVMFYDAQIKAGIDMSKVDINVKNKKITIQLPSAEILSYSVDPNSIEFFDEAFALFNWESKKDAVEALKIAEADSREKVNESELLTQAYERAEKLIRNYLENYAHFEQIIIE